MTAALAGEVFGFDLETTGRDPLTARIVSAACVRVGAGGEVLDDLTWLSDPGVDIPADAEAVHGISTAHVRTHGLPRADVLEQIVQEMVRLRDVGAVLCGHNISYDLTVLAGEAARTGVIGTPADLLASLPTIADTLVLDRWADRFRPGRRTLSATTEQYGIPLSGAHEACADAIASARLAQAITGRDDRLAVMGGKDLMRLQRRVHRAQAASLEAHLRRRNPDAYVSPEWPIQVRGLARAAG